MTWRRLYLALALVAALHGGGCGSLEQPQRLHAEDVVSTLKERAGLSLRPTARVDESAALVNLEAGYTAGAPGKRLLVLVFDTRRATRQVLGESARRIPRDSALERANVVVLLQGEPVDTKEVGALRSALAAVESRS